MRRAATPTVLTLLAALAGCGEEDEGRDNPPCGWDPDDNCWDEVAEAVMACKPDPPWQADTGNTALHCEYEGGESVDLTGATDVASWKDSTDRGFALNDASGTVCAQYEESDDGSTLTWSVSAGGVTFSSVETDEEVAYTCSDGTQHVCTPEGAGVYPGLGRKTGTSDYGSDGEVNIWVHSNGPDGEFRSSNLFTCQP